MISCGAKADGGAQRQVGWRVAGAARLQRGAVGHEIERFLVTLRDELPEERLDGGLVERLERAALVHREADHKFAEVAARRAEYRHLRAC